MAALLAISIITTALSNCLQNYIGKNCINDREDSYIFNAIQYFVPFVIFFFISLMGKVSWFAVLFGALFGVVTVLAGVSKFFAYSVGPMYITNLICTSSMIIPTLSGVFFGEKLSALKIFFILVLIFFLFITTFKKGEKKGFNFKWLIFCIVAFILGGMIGVMQKVFRSTEYGDQSGPFLASTFLIAFLYSLFMTKGKKGKKGKSFVVTAIICGVCIFLGNLINLYLSGVMPTQLFFPLANGLPLITCSIVAFTLFKEKFYFIQLIGLIGGIASLILICLV